MKNLLVWSIISSIIAIVLLLVVLKGEKKENLCLCDNLGNPVYKHVDYSPYVYNYKLTEFGF